MGNAPYHQRTDLGWGLVGLIDPNEVDMDDNKSKSQDLDI